MEYEVNKRIRQYRSAADMSQADMADKLSIKRSTYARRESKGKFDSETIMKISEILKISPMILLYGENEFNVGVTVHDGKKTPFEPTDDFVITTKERKL